MREAAPPVRENRENRLRLPVSLSRLQDSYRPDAACGGGVSPFRGRSTGPCRPMKDVGGGPHRLRVRRSLGLVPQEVRGVGAHNNLPAGATLHPGEHLRDVADDVRMQREFRFLQEKRSRAFKHYPKQSEEPQRPV